MKPKLLKSLNDSNDTAAVVPAGYGKSDIIIKKSPARQVDEALLSLYYTGPGSTFICIHMQISRNVHLNSLLNKFRSRNCGVS